MLECMEADDGLDRRTQRLPWRFVVLATAVAMLAVSWPVLGVGESFERLQGWVASLGLLGPVAYAALGALAVTVLVPAGVVAVTGGALFGPVVGTVSVAVAVNGASAATFLIARYVARDEVHERLCRRRGFRRLDGAVAASGPLAVGFVRFVPVFHFGVMGYALGLTAVPFGTYALMTGLASFPGVLLYTVGSAAIIDLLTGEGVSAPLVAVVVAALVAVVVVYVWARRRMRRPGGGRPDEVYRTPPRERSDP